MEKKYGVKEVVDAIMIDPATRKPLMFLDSLKMSALENTAESVHARGGKGNAKLVTWDFNRESILRLQDALMSEKSLALMTGVAEVKGMTVVHKREVLIAVADGTSGTKVTLSKQPTAVIGADPVTVLKSLDLSEISGTGVTMPTGTVTDIKFATSVGIAEGDEVIVYYSVDTSASATRFSIQANKFPKVVKLVGLTVVRNTDGDDEPFEIVIHRAKIQPNFNLTFQADGEPTVFDMSLDVLKPNGSDEMVSMVKYID